jgi:MYXO-CTERM domain-containing protein
MSDPPLTVPLDQPALHVDVAPGGEIILRGAYQSKFDGSTVDAAATTWPATAPGGASVDAGGLIDFEGGGFHVTSRDPLRHEVHAVATGDAAAACSALRVAAPCLPVRMQKLAVSRLLTVADWRASMLGPPAGLAVEVVAPPVYAPPPAAVPYLEIAGAALAVGLAASFLWRRRKQQIASPAGRLAALAATVREKLGRADGVVAAPLAPAVETALRALRAKRIDATSAEGKRVEAVLLRVSARLDESAERARAEEEQQAADELVQEFEAALEAADEATLAVPRAQRT